MDRNDTYRPSYGNSREPRHGYYDSYSSRPPPPRYDDAPPPPRGNQDADMFHFRGAADRAARNHHEGSSYRPRDIQGGGGDNYRPGGGDNHRPGDRTGGGDSFRPGERSHQANNRAFDFNFRAGDAPSFPANNGPRPQGSQNSRARRGAHVRGRGRPWTVRRAGDRALLRTKREPTPEQLNGMNEEGTSRFKVLEDMSDSQSEAMDISDDEDADAPPQARGRNAHEDSDASDDEHPRAKRARVHSPTTETAAAPAETKPKWSNPDVYTVLPCPDGTETRKGKDVVKLIRKAKVDSSKSEAKSSTASDFISLNDDDDDEEDEGALSGSDEEDTRQASRNGQSSFSHLNHLHPDRVPAPSSATGDANASAPATMNRSVPASRLDVWPPPPPENDRAVRDVYSQALHKQEANDTSAHALKKNKKRKHDETERRLGDIVEEWVALEEVDPAPWLNVEAEGFPKLHQEILDFYDFVKPREFEERVRLDLIDRVQQAISAQFPQFKIVPFGSFASGLYLPTADMDLVACTRSFLNGSAPSLVSKSMMYKFGRCLETAKVIQPGTLTVIAMARVPIIKFVERTSGLRFDISFENDSGLAAQKTFTKWKRDYPAMPIIVSLIKQFLVMRGMSEVFQGGLGGYSVICLVVSVIRLLQSEKKEEGWVATDHLDTILMEFLRHYGNEFDFTKLGIKMEPWEYVKKSKWTPQGSKRSKFDRLLIVDPNKYNNDISGGSAQVQLIFDLFSESFESIKKNLDQVEEVYEKSEGREKTSILDCIWGGNYEVFELQRSRMSRLAGGEYDQDIPEDELALTTSLSSLEARRLRCAENISPSSTLSPRGLADLKPAIPQWRLADPEPANVKREIHPNTYEAGESGRWTRAPWTVGYAPGTSGFQSSGSY